MYPPWRITLSARNFAALSQRDGDTPAQFAERRGPMRPAAAQQTVVPVETIAEECGFGNAERMRRLFRGQSARARFRSTLLSWILKKSLRRRTLNRGAASGLRLTFRRVVGLSPQEYRFRFMSTGGE